MKNQETTVFHKNFGKGQLISEDDKYFIIKFSTGDKKLLKSFTRLLTEEDYNKSLEQKNIVFIPSKSIKHKIILLSEHQLIAILKKQESLMQKNYYFDIDEVVNSEIYSNGVNYFDNTKKLIGDSWQLAMYFAKER